MDKKIGFLTLVSVCAVLASGCSSYRFTSQGAYGSDGDSYGSGSSQRAGSGQVSGSEQVGTRNRWFGQQYRQPETCKPCATTPAPKPKPAVQNTYTYKPAPKPKTQTSTHNQQYYIDRWKRQQQAQKQQPAPTTYSGYGTGSYDTGNKGNSTYYDYSTAGASDTGGSVATSNKSIYSGSYQQKSYKPYTPKTYTGGSSATTNTSSVYTSASSASSGTGGSTYIVKKGDTVFEIMRQTGVYWKDIIRINNLQPPYNITPGQTIYLK